MKRKVAIYARVSTEHEAQINALGNQIQYYDNILAMHPEWELVDRYIDEGITGTSVKKRKNFMRMMKDAMDGKFSLIITREVSRFARNTVDTLQQTRVLRRNGIEVYFTEDNIWTMNDEDGELRLTLMATLAQNESKKTSTRVKAGQKVSFENGVLYGNGNILGYDRNGKDLVINKEQAETVKMIFDLYLEGNGSKRIAYILESRGRLTATGKTKWQPGTISRILRNPFYCGRVVYRKQYVPDYLEQKKINNFGDVEKIEVKGTHECIVSEEEFDRAQKLLNQKSVAVDNRGRRGVKLPKSLYGKLLVCECGSTFMRTTWHKYKDGRKQFGYQCHKQSNLGSYQVRKKRGLDVEGACDVMMFPEWKLRLQANWIFRDFWKDKNTIIEKAVKMLEAHMNDDNPYDSSEEIENIKKQINKEEKKLDGLVELRLEGDISKEVYDEKKANVKNSLSCLKEKLLNLEGTTNCFRDNINDRIDILKELMETEFDSFIGNVPDELVGQFVDKIIVHKDWFEWKLKNINNPVKCKVIGTKKDNELLILSDLTSESAMQHRQLLQKVGNNRLWCQKPLNIGNFTVSKDYLKEYKKFDKNMKKAGKWEDINVTITV